MELITVSIRAARARDFQAPGAAAMMEQDPMLLDFQKLLIVRDLLRGRQVALKNGAESLACVLLEVRELIEHL